MKELIDKTTVVAEIGNCYNECLKRAEIVDADYWNAKADAYRNVLTILDDTLEVKEVDINKEISQFIDANFEKATIGHKLSLRRVAKHFFELGLKAKKGE